MELLNNSYAFYMLGRGSAPLQTPPLSVNAFCIVTNSDHGQESSTCWSSTLRRRRRPWNSSLPQTVICSIILTNKTTWAFEWDVDTVERTVQCTSYTSRRCYQRTGSCWRCKPFCTYMTLTLNMSSFFLWSVYFGLLRLIHWKSFVSWKSVLIDVWRKQQNILRSFGTVIIIITVPIGNTLHQLCHPIST